MDETLQHETVGTGKKPSKYRVELFLNEPVASRGQRCGWRLSDHVETDSNLSNRATDTGRVTDLVSCEMHQLTPQVPYFDWMVPVFVSLRRQVPTFNLSRRLLECHRFGSLTRTHTCHLTCNDKYQ